MKRVLAALLLVAGPAMADTPPPVQPQRDVDVTYKVPVPGVNVTAILQRLRFSATLHKQRLDMPTSGNFMVLDFTAHTMAMVRDQSHEIIDMAAPDNVGLAGAGAGFTRVGSATVAGLPCTEWRTVDTRGQETVACYTADGVLLRATNANGPLTEAIEVKYGPLPASVFDLPEGYSHTNPNNPPN